MGKEPDAGKFGRIAGEYYRRLPLYGDFCGSVHNLLVALLERHGFKYQVSWRLKSLESIREKVRRYAAQGLRCRTLADIEDLAGIRIVFYVERDVRLFLSLLMLELTRGRLKVEEHRKDRGYRATHVIVELGAKRLALNEYARFKGLKCEVQMTSALYHAWAEIEHDLVYKRRGSLAPLSRRSLARLEQQLDQAMAAYLIPASEMLDAIADRGFRPGRRGARRLR